MSRFIFLKNLNQLEILRLKTLCLTTVHPHLSHTVHRTLITLNPRLKPPSQPESLRPKTRYLTTVHPPRLSHTTLITLDPRLKPLTLKCFVLTTLDSYRVLE
jgi:hypothetical protein